MNPCHLIVRGSAIALLSLTVSASGQSQVDYWKAVKSLTHKTTFGAVDKAHNCTEGTIQKATDNELVLKASSSAVTIPKSNLLRLKAGPWRAPRIASWDSIYATVYNSRSSWSDLQKLAPGPANLWARDVPVRVEDTDRKLYKGTLREVSDKGITLSQLNTEVVIQKAKVARVERVIEKPLSDSAEYCAQECTYLVIFDPELWPRIFHVGDTLPVLIYDSSLPQDDLPVRCE